MWPVYLPPGKYGEKSEVFSFGVVLLELLTGKVQNDHSCNLVLVFHDYEQEDIAKALDGRAGIWPMKVQCIESSKP